MRNGRNSGWSSQSFTAMVTNSLVRCVTCILTIYKFTLCYLLATWINSSKLLSTKLQLKYNPRHLSQFGLQDGELMERLWSYLQSFHKTTKEMTPAHQINRPTDWCSAILAWQETWLNRLIQTACVSPLYPANLVFQQCSSLNTETFYCRLQIVPLDLVKVQIYDTAKNLLEVSQEILDQLLASTAKMLNTSKSGTHESKWSF